MDSMKERQDSIPNRLKTLSLAAVVVVFVIFIIIPSTIQLTGLSDLKTVLNIDVNGQVAQWAGIAAAIILSIFSLLISYSKIKKKD